MQKVQEWGIDTPFISWLGIWTLLSVEDTAEGDV